MSAWPSEVDVAEPLPLFFARTRAAALSAGERRPAVAIVPDAPKFNNFSKYYWAEMYVVRPDMPVEQLSVMLMFLGHLNTKAYLDECFVTEDAPVIEARGLQVPFVTLFNDAQSYGHLVDLLGFDVAVATLLANHDAVAGGVGGADSETAALTGTVDFHEGVVRNPETYASLREGARHLTPYGSSSVTDARSRIVVGFRPRGEDSVISAEFDFRSDEFARDRLAVLIGRNGVGKTQLIQSMIEGLRRHPEDRGSHGAEPAIFETPLAASRLIVMSSVAADTYPRSIPAWSGLDYEYLSLVPQRDGGGRSLLSALLDCLRGPGDRSLRHRDETLDRYSLLKRLLHRLTFWHQLQLPVTKPLKDDVLKGYEIDGGRYVSPIGLSGEQRRIRLAAEADHAREIVILSDEGGVRQLSSGEAAMLRFVVHAVSSIERGSFVVMEEPESYLHPAFVSEMMGLLHDLLEATGSVALVVTHSAYVVREATRERVMIMRDAPDGREVVRAPLQTFGASIDAISQFVFGDSKLPHQHLVTLRDWLERHPGMTRERLAAEYASKLNPETMSYLVGLLNGEKDDPVSESRS